MRKLIEKPHLIFLLAIPIVLLLGIWSTDANNVINIHDTYYVITHLSLTIVLSVLFAIIGFGYWIIRKTSRKLIKWLTWIHIVLTIGVLLAFLILPFLSVGSGTESAFPLRDEMERKDFIRAILILLFIFVQLIFLINMAVGISRKIRIAVNKTKSH